MRLNLLAALALLAAPQVFAAGSQESAASKDAGGRQVVVTVLSWYSPIGSLNGSLWWGQSGYGYEGAKASNGVQNYPLTSGIGLPSRAPEVGGSAFDRVQYQAALEDLRQMRAAGFDVAAFDMLPMPRFDPSKPLDASNAPFTHYKTFLQWLRAGEKVGMKVALFADVKNQSADYPAGRVLDVQEWVETLGGALDNLGQSPAVWRIDGKPVVIHFGTDASSGAPPMAGAERPDGGWRHVLKALRDSGRSFYFVADVRPPQAGEVRKWSRMADAVHMFAPASPASFMAAQQAGMGASFTVPYMWSVSPGYYNAALDAYTEPDFRRIHDTYLAAMKAGARLMNVLTWNDFGEDTDIAPSANKGTCLLEVFSYYNHWFKSGQQPAVTDDKVIIAYPMRIPNEVRTRSPVYGGGKWVAPPYAPKVFYWANVRAAQTLEVAGVGKVELPRGLSMGELGLAEPGPVVATLDGQKMMLPGIARSGVERQRDGEGGLEYRYRQLATGGRQ